MNIRPSLNEFKEYAQQGNLIPLSCEVLADQYTPVGLYALLRTQSENTFIFESVEGGEQVGRYSMLGLDPIELIVAHQGTVTLTSKDGAVEVKKKVEPLQVVEERMSRFKPVHYPECPRFVGGAVGYLGYDCVAGFDKVTLNPNPGLDTPELVYGIFDTVYVFDRVRHTITLVVNAFIEGDLEATYQKAKDTLTERLDQLATALPLRHIPASPPHAPLPVTSNTEHGAYLKGVERAKEYIKAGDIIQVVLSQRFESMGAYDALAVYRALRYINPSPYLFCLEMGGQKLIGSSPEIHVRSEDRRVQIRPIAGTRPRGGTPEVDQQLEEELLADPKERAEHVMLVDLARNDIGRVCDWGSVEVADFMIIERYSHVMHIVSDVTGRLSEDKSAYDLMRATFPAGTLTGAPKIRAMNIIAELEEERRGSYGGAVGYFGFDGNVDSCITIRTVLLQKDGAYVQAGAGIVADSDPQKEHEECQNKARGMLKALALAKAYQEVTT